MTIGSRQVDYVELEHLLSTNQWQAANQETINLMLHASGKEVDDSLYLEDVEAIPSEDLVTVDKLWRDFSGGRFGFSIQASIWRKIEGIKDCESDAAEETCSRFYEFVGWWNDINFTNPSLHGHLPAWFLGCGGDDRYGWVVDVSILSYLEYEFRPLTINPRVINGSWRYGVALDWHTLSSVHRSDGGFDTTRSEIGEALYQLKYQFDRSKIEPIAEVAAQQIISWRVFRYLKAIIAIPPSKLDRPFQPVLELAKALGRKTNLPMPDDYLIKVRQTQALKDIEDTELRHQQMQNAFQVTDQRYSQESVLLFDDLFRSGETLNAVSNALVAQGNVGRIYVLTVTMTRTKR